MLFFGHIGITMGVIKASDMLMSKVKSSTHYRSNDDSKVNKAIGSEPRDFSTLSHRIKESAGSIDYRLVLLGSLLPDIIDKPVWLLFGSNTSLSGRDYSHTLLFNLALLISGLILARCGKSGVLILSLSSFAHLVFDQMWERPAALLWPLLGPLPKEKTAGWFANLFQGLISSPEVYIPEIIGLVILLIFASHLTRRKKVTAFLRGGALV